MIYRTELRYTTSGEGDILDITSQVRAAASQSGISEGIVSLFVQGSTAALTTIEYEPGVLSDLRRALDLIAPVGIPYKHDAAWGDGNGRSHVRAALIGPSLMIPLQEGELLCGIWQQIVLIELDIRQTRERTVFCTIIGENKEKYTQNPDSCF